MTKEGLEVQGDCVSLREEIQRLARENEALRGSARIWIRLSEQLLQAREECRRLGVAPPVCCGSVAPRVSAE